MWRETTRASTRMLSSSSQCTLLRPSSHSTLPMMLPASSFTTTPNASMRSMRSSLPPVCVCSSPIPMCVHAHQATTVPHRSMMMAQPRDRLPARVISVHCTRCQTLLYRYHKGGKGSLRKCYLARIEEDFTADVCVCPKCSQVFGRPDLVHGKPAHKIISGKVYTKG
jgi:hypothetical protein